MFKRLIMKYSIKLFVFVFFFCANCFVLHAQQKHFIYVQSEDKQPFAIVMNGKVYSSSDYGYIILPKLTDGDYNFTVSFPLNKFPDQSFTCSINKKDAGYILKNNSDGWALENMQTQKSITSGSNTTAKSNAFGDMLSDVVSDSDLTKKDISANNSPVTNITNETVAASGTVTDAANTGFITKANAQPQKIAESKLDTGTSMLFVDKSQSGVDTINVFIPSEKTDSVAATTNGNEASPGNIAAENSQSVNPVTTTPTTNSDTALQENVTSNTQKENNNSVVNNQSSDVSNPFYKSENNNAVVDSTQTNQPPTNNTSAAIKEDCSKMITDEDFNKLKRKMFVQKNTNEMIQYAVRFLNNKCITTDQVKTLGYLFSSDDGRYNLYDALYNYVYDYGNYSQLASSILDSYYKKRFAAMLR